MLLQAVVWQRFCLASYSTCVFKFFLLIWGIRKIFSRELTQRGMIWEPWAASVFQIRAADVHTALTNLHP